MEDSEGWRAEGKESLNRVPDAWSSQTSQPQTQRFPCPATSGILEIIGMWLMPRRKRKKKEKAFKTKNKNKVQFRILLSRKNRDEGVGVHQAIPGRDCM